MIIDVIGVGKIKEKYISDGIKEYTKRLSRYTTLNIIEVDDEKAPENLSEKDQEMIKKKEGERILSKISQDAYVIGLTIDGKGLSSEGLADKINKLMIEGNSHITFIIGGSLGLSDEVIKRAQMKLSFSKMTFPHQLMRMILLEQVYRSFRIIRNEPYHKWGEMMAKHNIYKMPFAKVYPLLVAKAEKKGRRKEEVDEIIIWLTGYSQEELETQLDKQIDFESFFEKAPKMNPSRSLIKGVVCGVRVEEIEEETMREIRYLDKLIDELAKGKTMDKILRKD